MVLIFLLILAQSGCLKLSAWNILSALLWDISRMLHRYHDRKMLEEILKNTIQKDEQ